MSGAEEAPAAAHSGVLRINTEPPARYAVVEMMGRRKAVGRVEERSLLGVPFLHVTTLGPDPLEHDLGAGSIYCITWCTREQAERAAHASHRPYELEAPQPPVFHVDRNPLDDRVHPTVDCADCHAAAGSACTPGCSLESYADRDDRVPVGSRCVNCGVEGPEHHTATCSRVREPPPSPWRPPGVVCAECKAGDGVPCDPTCGLMRSADDADIPF